MSQTKIKSLSRHSRARSYSSYVRCKGAMSPLDRSEPETDMEASGFPGSKQSTVWDFYGLPCVMFLLFLVLLLLTIPF